VAIPAIERQHGPTEVESSFSARRPTEYLGGLQNKQGEQAPTIHRLKTRIVQIGTAIIALVMTAVPSWAAEKIPDISNSDAETFKTHLGMTVSIQGRLSNGVQGA